MANIGNYALMVALAFSIFGTLAACISAFTNRSELLRAGIRAFVVTTFAVAVATVCLTSALLTDQFQITYVQNYSNITLPAIFKLTALWAGQAGSLLFWSLTLCTYFCIALIVWRKQARTCLAWAYFLIGLAVVFSLLINNLVANPFVHWVEISPDGNPIPFTPRDGSGLNPQLQHWAMVIHPPLLYLGYIGFLFPFAFALAALIARVEARSWIPLIRQWALAAWLILGIGIVLGAAWAYMELGWGGYWAWDPVENASLMPWLLGTAFLHTVIAQDKRGLFKKWNIGLIVATYLMCIFGTFITRSGLISSVHAFAESNIGRYYITYMVINLVFAIVVMIKRRDLLKDDRNFESLASRESGMLYGTVMLFAICMTTLVATLYPMFTEWIHGIEQEVSVSFYNRVELPIFLGLLFLMAIGPLMKWKRTSPGDLMRRMSFPALSAIVVGIVVLIRGDIPRLASISFMVLAFLLAAIVQQVIADARRQAKNPGRSTVFGLVSLITRKTRTLGAVLAHLGILAMGLGITGGAFNQEGKANLGVGEIVEVAGFTFQVASISERHAENYHALTSTVNVLKNGKLIRSFSPEQRHYPASQSNASEVSIGSTLLRDFYLVLSGIGQGHTAEHPKCVFNFYVNPLVSWIWIGGALLSLGTLLCMMGVPGKSRRPKSAASTQGGAS